jgi:nitrate/nitrite-specific signal transduction histidine kinase
MKELLHSVRAHLLAGYITTLLLMGLTAIGAATGASTVSLAAILGGAFILLALLGWLTLRTVAQPLDRLRLAAEAIGRGDFSRPVTANRIRKATAVRAPPHTPPR